MAKVRQDAPLFVCPSPEPEPEASSELDLGTKIRTPKDIMLEELSLMKNRGSKMFRMRQKRVERFIYENNPDIFTSESMVRSSFSFVSRIAVPFGGFEKANQFLKFQLPEAEATKQEPEPPVVYQHDIGCRPSFNRTPIGWVGSSEPGSIHMETDAVPFDGETDESCPVEGSIDPCCPPVSVLQSRLTADSFLPRRGMLKLGNYFT